MNNLGLSNVLQENRNDKAFSRFATHNMRTDAKLSLPGVPMKAVLERDEAAATTPGRFCVSPIYVGLRLLQCA